MKKNLVVIALLAALTIVFAGCTEGDAGISIADFTTFGGTSSVSAATVSTVTNNSGPCATLAGGIFTINPSASYQSAISFAFPGGIPAGASKLVIDYFTAGHTKSKFTLKDGANSGNDTSPATYNQAFKAGLAQYEIPTSKLTAGTGVTIEMAEVADNAAFSIRIINAEFQ